MEGDKRIFFIGLIVIALGVIFSTTLSDKLGSLGIAFIAIGGLLFIASMSRKENNTRHQIIHNKRLGSIQQRIYYLREFPGSGFVHNPAKGCGLP